LQPWGITQWQLVKNASRLAPLLLQTFGFNTLILLPTPAHNAYCPTSCRLSDLELQHAAAIFREAGWKIILYTSFMHCGEARQWQNGTINAEHPDWSQRNASGAAWQFEGVHAPLSPCSDAVQYTLEYTADQAAIVDPDAVMLDNNEMGPLAWGCEFSGCGYESVCQTAFRKYARARFNDSTLMECFLPPNATVADLGNLSAPERSALGTPLYGLWVHWRNMVRFVAFHQFCVLDLLHFRVGLR
jgi:hypothetical protein